MGEKAWLATDFVTDVTDDGLLCCMKVRDGFNVGEIAWLAADFVTDGGMNN